MAIKVGGVTVIDDSKNVTGNNIEAGGIATIPAGTAAAPTVNFAGDTNTGLFSPGADQVGISVGGAEALRVNASKALGLNGANYGTLGQVLVSGGPSAPVTWADDAGVIFTVSATAPVSPDNGDQWLNTNDGVVYTWVVDGTSNQWVELGSEPLVGPAGTITVGTVTTGAPGTSATVTNTGTASAAILNFQIPRGDAGPKYVSTTTAVNKTLVDGEMCTVTTPGLTITLPASPAAGAAVGIIVAGDFVDTVIARNGSNIMGVADDMIINSPNICVILFYVNATQGWRMIQ